jgi:DNA-binding MarR family transcriptional regulator
MTQEPDEKDVARALQASIGLFLRRMRQVQVEGELTLPQRSALSRLERGGSTTTGALAKLEEITSQSMGATLGALEARGLVERAPDPNDGRRAVVSITEAGLKALRDKRTARTELVAAALSAGFTPLELRQLMVAAPLIERLAQSL